jgi:hypothetical protein
MCSGDAQDVWQFGEYPVLTRVDTINYYDNNQGWLLECRLSNPQRTQDTLNVGCCQLYPEFTPRHCRVFRETTPEIAVGLKHNYIQSDRSSQLLTPLHYFMCINTLVTMTVVTHR